MFPSSARMRGISCPRFPNCPLKMFCRFTHSRASLASVATQTTTAKRTHSLIDQETNARVNSDADLIQCAFSDRPERMKKVALNEIEAADVDVPKQKSNINALKSHIQNMTETIPHAGPFGTSPRIGASLQSKVNRALRQKALDVFFLQFSRIYANIDCASVIYDHAIKQELQLLAKSTEKTYPTYKMGIYRRLKQRAPSKSLSDIGIDGEWNEQVISGRLVYNLATPPCLKSLEQYLMTSSELQAHEYPVFNDNSSEVTKQYSESNLKTCIRCNSSFTCVDHTKLDLSRKFSEDDSEAESLKTPRVEPGKTLPQCTFHYGRIRTRIVEGKKERYYLCCNQDITQKGCTIGPHVYKEELQELLDMRVFSFY